jgi:hypothetical protein
MSANADFISLQAAKDQLSIDAGLTVHDARITFLIAASIAWAQNYTQRNIGELMQLAAPVTPPVTLPDPLNTPDPRARFVEPGDDYAWQTVVNPATTPIVPNPIQTDQSLSDRTDVQAAILLHVELLFDRNVDNIELLEATAERLLDPYRIAMGVW